MSQTAVLALEDGSIFRGISIGDQGYAVGEVVFNTAMTGYQEILTDPSYAKQIVTLTYPHIGNVGVNTDDEESSRIYAGGLVIRDSSMVSSSWRSEQPLSAYLKQHGIVAISEIDTRKLTRLLREKGSLNGCIHAAENPNEAYALEKAKAFSGLSGMDLASEVTTSERYVWEFGTWSLNNAPSIAKSNLIYNVAAYDFGIKRNIMRILVDKGCRLTVYPATTPASEILLTKPDGVFLSNGPGDPEPCDYAIQAIREILDQGTPIFGICLGHQLLALACGAKTKKMKFGHHGANHPVQCIATQEVLISSQNHGFTVDESSLPQSVNVTYKSLFDGSLQGIEFSDKPAFSFQGHPEASPGPHDVGLLFDHFIELIECHKQRHA